MEKEKLLQLLKESSQEDKAKDKGYWDEIWQQYIHETSGHYDVLSSKEAIVRLISEKNYRERYDKTGCEELGVWIRIGDICYIDYGMCYLNEAGFQHFGLIINIVHNKAMVIPMTSNENTYREALKVNKSKHLLPIGKVKGMNKNSVLFLNDAKFINTARIIDVKAHIPIDSKLFKMIKDKTIDLLI